MEIHPPVQVTASCALCGADFPMANVTVLGTVECGDHVLHARCTRCLTGTLIRTYESNVGWSLAAAPTDLTADDVERFAGAAPISEDDVIDAHAMVELKPGALIDAILAKV